MILLLYCSCEADFLQAARPNIQQQLSLDLSFFHSSTVMLSAPSLVPVQATFGSASWLRRRGGPLGPKLGLSLKYWTGLCPGSFGLWQKQPPAVQNWPRGGRGAVCGCPGGVEGESGARWNGVTWTQPWRIFVCCLHTQTPTKVLQCVCVWGWGGCIFMHFLAICWMTCNHMKK